MAINSYRLSLSVVGVDWGRHPLIKFDEEGNPVIQHSGAPDEHAVTQKIYKKFPDSYVTDEAALKFLNQYQDRIHADLQKDKLPGRYRHRPEHYRGVTPVVDVRCYQKDGVLYWTKPKN
jgi:hypothetical protein